MLAVDQRRIVSAYGQVRGDLTETISLVLASTNHPFYSDPRSSVWSLLPLGNGRFTFYMSYAAQDIVMISRSSKFFWEKIAITANSQRYPKENNYFTIHCSYSLIGTQN